MVAFLPPLDHSRLSDVLSTQNSSCVQLSNHCACSLQPGMVVGCRFCNLGIVRLQADFAAISFRAGSVTLGRK